MKTWMNAEVVELNIAATAQGGKNLTTIDATWIEKDTNAAYASYASGDGASNDNYSGEIDNPNENK